MKRFKKHAVDKWVHVSELKGIVERRELMYWTAVVWIPGGEDVVTVVWGK